MDRYSVLPALSLDGILYIKIVKESFKYDSFGEFIDGLLDQMSLFPGPNSVIVMDNCRIHKSEAVLERIVKRWDNIILMILLPNNKQVAWNMSFFHLTPWISIWSSQLSQLSGHIYHNGGLFRAATESQDQMTAVLTQLHDAVWSVTAEDTWGLYHHCGYL